MKDKRENKKLRNEKGNQTRKIEKEQECDGRHALIGYSLLFL